MRRSRAPFVRASLALHAAGAVGLAAAPGAWPWIVAGLVADHLTLVAAGLWPRSTWLGPNLRRVASLRDAVVLSFDDGPDPDVTPEVLERLAERGAQASFFCVGRLGERHPDLVAAIARRGHAIENHSYRHSSAFSLFGPRAMAREIDRAQRALERLSGTAPSHFRAPAGLRNLWLDSLLAERNLALVSWTRRGFDKVARDPRAVASRLLRGIAPGDILLLHDGAPARAADGRPVVHDALAYVLDGLDRAGLRAVALPRGGAER